MSITPKVQRISTNQRAALNRVVNQTTRSLVSAWDEAWKTVSAEWVAALTELAAAGEDGRWPTRSQVLRAERAQRALDMTTQLLARLSTDSAVTISATLPKLSTDAAAYTARMVEAQLPPGASDTVTAGVGFNRVDPMQLEAIVNRTTQQITALHYPISAEATAAIQQELIRGIVVGDNPRTAAHRMLKRVEGRFNGGLSRAVNVARTEMLDANRSAAQAQELANKDVLTAWEWSAKLDSRTCISCLVQNGSTHPIEDPGPLDHQQGRCSRIPVTKTWRELGFNVDEPVGVKTDSKAWFNGLPEAEQSSIMGADRLALFKAGDVSWEDLSSRRTNSGWRDSFTPTPVSQLRRTE